MSRFELLEQALSVIVMAFLLLSECFQTKPSIDDSAQQNHELLSGITAPVILTTHAVILWRACVQRELSLRKKRWNSFLSEEKAIFIKNYMEMYFLLHFGLKRSRRSVGGK